ncbi:MAG: glutamate--tRNA ligase [Candidatus Eremiobacteraeota bacterium]|nr:glutamate--tRNA ligase [Candidatus Eremiobacteraeota bacterium]
MTVRTRVAPSPTGDPHVGTAYVALINYCFAKKHGGQFVLRIEDTDRARSTLQSERAILDSLHWLGLTWDEGPDIGGPHGPYRQSERSDLYARYAAQLLRDGHAFQCFCTPQRLDDMRQAQRAAKVPPRYDGSCARLPGEEVARREREGVPFVLRLTVPETGTCVVEDLRRGPISIDWNTVDMQVLMKSDGMPTYHLANVVDDHLMDITHVIRGEEWVSSAPKHSLLYQYFGWQAPAFMHVPLLRNPDKSKLSKRKNPTSIFFYQAMGYLPEALLNFLGLLAVSSAEGEEVMSLPGLIERFDLSHIALGGPVFDVAKLDWLNGRYIRETLDEGAFADRVRAWAFTPERLAEIARLAHSRIERLSDLGPLCAFFFSGRIAVDAVTLRDGKLDDESLRKAFSLASWGFDALAEWNVKAIETVFKGVSAVLERKLREVTRPFYVAITGSPTSVPLYDSMHVLGRDIVRERLRAAIEVLGGVSAAEQKTWKNLALRAEELPS